MSVSSLVVVSAAGAAMVDRYYPLRVKLVVTETADAVTIVFDVPTALSPVFRYLAGQFVTLRVEPDGEPSVRSYSMSSSPATDRQRISRVLMMSSTSADHSAHSSSTILATG